MVLVCREARGTPTCTTVAGATVKMEIYPVGTNTILEASDPVNKIRNPSAIVVYKDDQVTENTAAVVELTRAVPNSLKLNDDTPVVWTITSLGGKAKFYNGKDRGSKVRIYGTQPGEILIEADYGWLHKAKMRTVVVELKQVKFRVTRVRSGAFGPKQSIDDIKKHIRIANLYLRQVGIKLVPDTSTEIAKKTGNPKVGNSAIDAKIDKCEMVEQGYFDVEVNDVNMTRTSGTQANENRAIRVNALNEILSIAYVHALGPSILGNARLCPVNHGGARSNPPTAAATAGTHTVSDTGTPTSSWVAPNGLTTGSLPSSPPPPPPAPPRPPARHTGDPTGTPAATVTMGLFPPDVGWQGSSLATRDIDLLWGVAMDGSANAPQKFGNTLAHELGHYFGLRHRGTSVPDLDQVPWPSERIKSGGVVLHEGQNLMDSVSPDPHAENLDIIQCKAVQFSEVFFRPGALSTAREYEPSDHAPGILKGAAIGALVGAVVGAIVGALVGFIASGGNPAAAAQGALIGAAIGAGVGALAGGIIGGLSGPPVGPP